MTAELIGSRPSDRRPALYDRCRPRLGLEARKFWDARPEDVRRGIGGAGKFERYLALFAARVLYRGYAYVEGGGV
ncbi:MAG: hypothetical protein ACE5EU_12225 [Paracoccaceae bacterium]